MHGRLVAGLAAAALLAAAPAGAVVPGGNLLVNPGAEAGPGAPDSSQQLPLPGWTVESTFTAVQYGTSGFPTIPDSATLGGGVNFFAGGPGGALSAATQVVNLSGAAAEIDAGQVTATLSALLGGFATQTDNATVSATFLNAGGAPGGAIRLPTVNPGDRNSVTALVARSSSAPVPAATRQISVRIDAIRHEGSYNDGYIDNVSLVLRYEGVFKVTQSGGTTVLALTQPLASCRGRGASAAAKKKPGKRHLWGDGKGSFRTSGQYSSATVRGTKWLVQDSCAGTVTRVVRGSVKVRDNVRRTTVTVAAGKSYLARPRR